MDDKETLCQGSNFGDFKSVDEVVRFYKLPDQKTKTSKDKVNSFSKSVCQCQNFKQIPRKMGFRFGFSIDIYAKIQNFKSIAAMQLFLWSLCYSR